MSNLNRILVGIRDSKLSRTQTNILLNRLVSVSSEITNESFVIKTIKTKGDIHNEKIVDIMENLVEKATKAGKVLGSTFVGTDKCEKWINKGYNFMNIADPLSLGTDKLKSEIERLKNL